MKEDCNAKFPKRFDTKNADYDGHFKCSEDVRSTQEAFREKQDLEICQKFNVSCKK